jgi:hypothetical protein
LIEIEWRLSAPWERCRRRNDAAVTSALRVEVAGRVELVAAQVLEDRSAEAVAARLGDDAHLSTGAGAELRLIAARLDAELLHVLETRL